ncbi:MAG TPA: Flp pilus assembly protein CpaB [Acidimicrobiia bacterium]|nr:Flp pilus assembly protein CpaB [Acidimicrobiia bacterium]
MGNRRTLIAAAAVILAAVSGIGVYFYVSSADQRAQRNVAVVEAFVASADIAKGTTGDTAVGNGLITTAKVLRGSIPPGAVTDSSTLKGKVAAATIAAKQFITAASFVSPAQGGGGSLAAALGSNPNLVAVTVSVDSAHAVANTIAPGDHVDIAVVNDAGAQYLLQDVRVLAVGQETAANAGSNGQPTTSAASSGLITFQVSAADALRVESSAHAGTLYLSLRSLGASGSGGATVPASGR